MKSCGNALRHSPVVWATSLSTDDVGGSRPRFLPSRGLNISLSFDMKRQDTSGLVWAVQRTSIQSVSKTLQHVQHPLPDSLGRTFGSYTSGRWNTIGLSARSREASIFSMIQALKTAKAGWGETYGPETNLFMHSSGLDLLCKVVAGCNRTIPRAMTEEKTF